MHRLIESHRLRFVLSGSSARKLRRGGANLLAGRAVTMSMFPLVSAELSFRIDPTRVLLYGTLPLAVTTDDPRIIFERMPKPTSFRKSRPRH